ncbi:class I SAM-dependent methyltransferase [Virgibacillus doumboii]|uniref:class I SAM-dependent methyltransferase n=1 Tax=Virgibacillus doumboii TaxID=2697503 RepID=UPI0013DEDA69|nr:class I SAM-dependent methyltransferase [Virgibacillus doumboii]
MDKDKLIKKYDKHVNKYKRTLDTNHTLAKWRTEILNDAHGKVLEVGVGVGSNFPFYNRENVQVTGVDFSPEMIKSAKQTALACKLDIKLLQKDVEELQFEDDSFDCIVSTLTMCGYPNPVTVLNNFNNWCKKDGRVLLMEHGISSKVLLSRTQKMVDPLFIKFTGCHCDRNIIDMVEKSCLEIDRTQSHWSDIIQMIWARPDK